MEGEGVRKEEKEKGGGDTHKMAATHIFPTLRQEAGGITGLRAAAGCDWLPAAKSAAPIGGEAVNRAFSASRVPSPCGAHGRGWERRPGRGGKGWPGLGPP